MKTTLALPLLLAACAHAGTTPASAIRLTDAEALEIGGKIWNNESRRSVDGLTHWNKGEEFASLGIGHFLWYPAGYDGPFTESFPGLLDKIEASGRALPSWLRSDQPCPWNTKDAFFADFRSPRMNELRQLLVDTIGLQARYAADRLEAALPRVLAAAPASERPALQARFERVAAAASGVYALVDYVNFKGEGINPRERYAGKGWGLLQVLQGMADTPPGAPAVAEFARSAKKALDDRIAASDPARGEARWREGWHKRIDTYLE